MAIKEQIIKKSALTPTILIAGGAGFIGSHLAQRLLERDARVIVLDDFRTGKDVYVGALLKNPKFALFDADINEGIPKNIVSVDYIIHLAGVESYLYNREDINLDSLLTNALGTKNLLDLAEASEAKFLLVSSIDVYQGLISPMDLEHYFGSTPEEENKYSLSEAKRFAEALVWEFYKKNRTDVRIARVPEVYGPRMNLSSSGNLGRLVRELVETGRLTIYGEGTEKEFYLFISDAVTGLVKALFNNHTDGKIFTIAPEEPHAVLETAYLLKSLADREIQIQFKRKIVQKTRSAAKISDRGDFKALKWEARVEFKSGLKKTLEWFGYKPNLHAFKPNQLIEEKIRGKKEKNGLSISSIIDHSKKPEKPKSPKVKKELKLPKLKFPTFKFSLFKGNVGAAVAAVLLALFTLVGAPFVQTYMYVVAGTNKITQIPELLAQTETEKAAEYANDAFQSFYKAQNALSRVKWLFKMVGYDETYSSFSAALSSSTYFSKGTYSLAKAAKPFSSIWDTIKPNNNEKLDRNTFSQAEINLKEAKNNFQQAEGELKRVSKDRLPAALVQNLEEYEYRLGTVTEAVGTATTLSSEIADILGADGVSKKYMVLFQNSNEIRPTGGFIGSYSIVELEDGKISSLIIDDIYNPDGQLDIKDIVVTPPTVLSELLEEDRLYIRNANWDPSFPVSARTIANLYSQIDGAEIDGVIAIDLHLAEKILNVTGPLFLTAFGEEINAENLYERTQFHSGFNFESGSTQKRDFLTIFGSKLLESIFALPKEDLPQLVSELSAGLNERHAMIHLFSSPFEAELDKNNWNGDLVNTDSDYLYVVNSNLGGTKANYYVENSMDYIVTSQTRDGLLRGALKLSYNHTGEDSAWPGGPYKDYIRVLTQNGSKLTGATVSYNESAGQDLFESITIDKVGKYTSFETLIELQPQQNVVVTFYYDLPVDLSIGSLNREYSLYWQKQPGTQGDDISFTFEPPFSMAIENPTQIPTELNQDLNLNYILN